MTEENFRFCLKWKHFLLKLDTEQNIQLSVDFNL